MGRYLTTLRNDALFPIESQFNRLFDSFFSSDFLDGVKTSTGYPAMNVCTEDNQWIVRVAVPGLRQEDLDVSLKENRLTITGRLSSDYSDEKGEFYVKEIRQSSFSRELTLPNYVRGDPTLAELKDGMLTLRWKIPKEEPEECKRIKIG